MGSGRSHATGPSAGTTARSERQDERGQSMVETLLSLSLLLVIVMGLLQLALLASTRHVVNYAAFAGARASLYGNQGDGRAAARDVTRILGYATRTPTLSPGRTRFRVRYPTPFALPIFNQGQREVVVTGEAPVFVQPTLRGGDNGG